MQKTIVHSATSINGAIFGVLREQFRNLQPNWLIVQFEQAPATIKNIGMIIAEEPTKKAAIANVDRVCSEGITK